MQGNTFGKHTGDVCGNVEGNVIGNVIGNTTGTHIGAVIGNVIGDVQGNTFGKHTGDVCGNVEGNVIGNLSGNTTGTHVGQVIGNVVGDVQGNTFGKHVGDVCGNVEGNVIGNVTGNTTGTHIGIVIGNVIGDVQGNTFGKHTGDVCGNVEGNVIGDVIGNVTGNTIGTHIGPVIGDMQGNTFGKHTGDVCGNLEGNVIGDIIGNLVGNTTGTHIGEVIGNVQGNTFGKHTGDVCGNVIGDVIGNTTGTHIGPVIGDLQGNVIGNTFGKHTGDVCGNLEGNVIGDIIGNLVGNTTGTHIGEVIGNVQGNTFGKHTGDVCGNIEGNVIGDVIGNLLGNTTGTHIGPVIGDVTGNVQGNVQGNTFGKHTGDVCGNLEGNVTGNVMCANVINVASILEKESGNGIQVTGNIIPSINDLFTLGNINRKFANIFTQDAFVCGNIFVEGNIIGNMMDPNVSLCVTTETVRLPSISGFVEVTGTAITNQTSVGATVTRNGVGNYTVTFDTPRPTADYEVFLQLEEMVPDNDFNIRVDNASRTTSSFDIRISEQDDGGTSGSLVDESFQFQVLTEKTYITGIKGSTVGNVNGDLNVTGNLTVDQNTLICGDLEIKGNLIGGNISNVTITDPLELGTLIANLVCSNILQVDAIETKTGGNITINTDVVIDGNITTTNKIIETQDVCINGNLLTNNITSKSGGEIIINGNLIPDEDKVFVIGSETQKWANIFTEDLNVCGNAMIENLNVTVLSGNTETPFAGNNTGRILVDGEIEILANTCRTNCTTAALYVRGDIAGAKNLDIAGNICGRLQNKRDIFLTFNEFEAGDTETEINALYGNLFGVTISSQLNPGTVGPAMIYDSSCPSGCSGGDSDLGTPSSFFGGPGLPANASNDVSEGKILILSQDGDSSDPNDTAFGGNIIFTFNQPVDLGILTMIDVEDVEFEFINSCTGELFRFDIADSGDNGRTDVNFLQKVGAAAVGVESLTVIFGGSGAIGRLSYAVCDSTWCGDGEFTEIRSKAQLQGNAIVNPFRIDVGASLIPSDNRDIDGNLIIKNLGSINNKWDAIFGNALNICGNANIEGDLIVTNGNIIGNIQLPDEIIVTKVIAETLCATANVEANIIVPKSGSSVTIDGDLEINGNISGDTTVDGNLTVSGNIIGSKLGKFDAYYDPPGAETIVPSTWTDVPLNVNRIIDTSFTHSTPDANVTIDLSGTYLVFARVTTYITASGTGNGRTNSQMKLQLNGADVAGSIACMYNRNDSQGCDSGFVTVILELNQGDNVKIQAIKSSVSGTNTLRLLSEGSALTITKI